MSAIFILKKEPPKNHGFLKDSYFVMDGPIDMIVRMF